MSRELLGRLVGERAGMGVGHARGLSPDRLGDAAVAVAEAGHRGAAGGVDDRAAVGGVQIDAFAADGDGRDGAGAMQDAAAHDAGARVSDRNAGCRPSRWSPLIASCPGGVTRSRQRLLQRTNPPLRLLHIQGNDDATLRI